MTQTQTTHHATRARNRAVSKMAAQGYQFDASNVRFIAMADGTHHLRRTAAYNDAAAIITDAQTAAHRQPRA